MKAMVLAVAVLCYFVSQASAMTCSEAFAQCSRRCAKLGQPPPECFGVLCGGAKAKCMQSGVFSTPKGGTTCKDCVKR